MELAHRFGKNAFKSLGVNRRLVRPLSRTLCKALLGRPFSSQKMRVLVVYENDPIAYSQVYPIFHYGEELDRRFGMEIRAMPTRHFLSGRGTRCRNSDVVILQTWFDIGESHRQKIQSAISSNHPNARLIYFDWFAPLDLRIFPVLSGLVDTYVKKQVFADMGNYLRSFRGDTNLEDYYGRRYDLGFPEFRWALPEGFEEKLQVGPGFFTDSRMIDAFQKPFLAVGKTIDLHSRIHVDGSEWYRVMRGEALAAVESIKGITKTGPGKVSRNEYTAELNRSRMCFSPFGYGEVCWRDYEAIMAGSLLLKPDMSHLRTEPEIFVPYETYIPLKWDLSDLSEKVHHYADNHEERRRIAENAYNVIHDYVVDQKFLGFFAQLTGSTESSGPEIEQAEVELDGLPERQ